MENLVLWLNQQVQALREFRRKIVVEEESQAAFASDYSNSMASRISSGWTSYHLATSSSDEFARTPRARICAGTPDFATVGWPKFRRGSTIICRFLPRGHHTISSPANSSSFRK